MALGPSLLYHLASCHPIIQVLLALLLICVCTRISSEYTYRSIKNGKRRGVKPPTLPYWIPGLKHALSMAWSAKYFSARCLKKYGDGTPFFIDAAGEKILVLMDPEHIKKVLQASSEADPNPFIHEKIMGQLMGSPTETIKYYQAENGKVDEVQTTQIRQYTTGTSLVSMTRKLFETLRRNVWAAFERGGDGEGVLPIPDLFAFIEEQLTLAITETLLGSTFLEGYPEMVRDMWVFIENTDNFFLGLPRLAIPSAYAARDRLLSHLKQWSRESERLRTNSKVEKSWDSAVGSALFQEREELYSSMPFHGEDGKAAQTLGMLYGGTSLTIPVTFWYFYETLKDTTLGKRISSEITTHFNADANTYDFMRLTARPILQSLHAETTRYRSSNLAVRLITAPIFALDEKYTVEKGTTCFIFAKHSGQFTPGWSNARAHSVARPLHEFWAERFLVDDQRERFSDAGFGGCWPSFGGGEHKCPGRHFARNIGIATLCVLMGEFECELMDAKKAGALDPPLMEAAFGTVRPVGNVAAKLRRRGRG